MCHHCYYLVLPCGQVGTGPGCPGRLLVSRRELKASGGVAAGASFSFIYLFRLYWVFTAVHRLSLVVVCGLLTVTSPVAERGF